VLPISPRGASLFTSASIYVDGSCIVSVAVVVVTFANYTYDTDGFSIRMVNSFNIIYHRKY
jgi:hypothetical protein